MSELDDVAGILNQVVELGPTVREVELGQAVSHHVAVRPAAARAAPDRDVVASLREMSAAVIRPGDILIIGTADQITHQHAANMREQLLDKLPGLKDVFVLGGASVEGIYREQT